MCSGDFWWLFEHLPAESKNKCFLGVPIVDNISGITCIIRILGGH